MADLAGAGVTGEPRPRRPTSARRSTGPVYTLGSMADRCGRLGGGRREAGKLHHVDGDVLALVAPARADAPEIPRREERHRPRRTCPPRSGPATAGDRSPAREAGLLHQLAPGGVGQALGAPCVADRRPARRAARSPDRGPRDGAARPAPACRRRSIATMTTTPVAPWRRHVLPAVLVDESGSGRGRGRAGVPFGRSRLAGHAPSLASRMSLRAALQYAVVGHDVDRVGLESSLDEQRLQSGARRDHRDGEVARVDAALERGVHLVGRDRRDGRRLGRRRSRAAGPTISAVTRASRRCSGRPSARRRCRPGTLGEGDLVGAEALLHQVEVELEHQLQRRDRLVRRGEHPARDGAAAPALHRVMYAP